MKNSLLSKQKYMCIHVYCCVFCLYEALGTMLLCGHTFSLDQYRWHKISTAAFCTRAAVYLKLCVLCNGVTWPNVA